MITENNISKNACDTLVLLYTNDILKTKAKIQALNHCQNEIETTKSEGWREFMTKVKDQIVVTKVN